MRNYVVAFGILFASGALANRESGGFQVPAALFVKFSAVQSQIDDGTYELAKSLIVQANKAGRVEEKLVSSNGTSEKLVCVRFREEAYPFRLSLDFVRNMESSILADRKKTGLERTQIFAGPKCSDFSKATEHFVQSEE